MEPHEQYYDSKKVYPYSCALLKDGDNNNPKVSRISISAGLKERICDHTSTRWLKIIGFDEMRSQSTRDKVCGDSKLKFEEPASQESNQLEEGTMSTTMPKRLSEASPLLVKRPSSPSRPKLAQKLSRRNLRVPK
ncbi:hypothetical protein Ancab_038901 [Ancistrocladus abbreviatus]